jgi:hypothetical protein
MTEIDLTSTSIVEVATTIDDHLFPLDDKAGGRNVPGALHRALFFSASRPIAIARLAM